MIVIEFILKDSIEELGDIIAKVEAVRVSLKNAGRFEASANIRHAKHMLAGCVTELEDNLQKLNNKDRK